MKLISMMEELRQVKQPQEPQEAAFGERKGNYSQRRDFRLVSIIDRYRARF
jgi:hypothetical protein